MRTRAWSERRPARGRRWLVAALLALAVAATACEQGDEDLASDDPLVEGADDAATASGGLASGLGSRAEGRTVTFIMHQDPSDPFHATIAQGAEDAATLFNLDLNRQSSLGNQSDYVDLVAAAVADRPDALAVVLDDPNLYTEPVCDAHEAGIPVLTFNITQPDSPVYDCTLAFVGQDFYEVGVLVGERLLAENPDIGAGDVVFAPVEFPEEFYARQRAGGVQEALDAVGATLDIVATDIQDAGALDVMTQYLLGRPDIAAVTPLGGTPHRNLVTAMNDAGVNVPVVGFDVSPQVISGIESGDIIATADQQGYVQGFQTVAQIALLLDFGLAPANINSGGAGLIDQSNVDIVAELAGEVR